MTERSCIHTHSVVRRLTTYSTSRFWVTRASSPGGCPHRISISALRPRWSMCASSRLPSALASHRTHQLSPATELTATLVRRFDGESSSVRVSHPCRSWGGGLRTVRGCVRSVRTTSRATVRPARRLTLTTLTASRPPSVAACRVRGQRTRASKSWCASRKCTRKECRCRVGRRRLGRGALLLGRWWQVVRRAGGSIGRGSLCPLVSQIYI